MAGSGNDTNKKSVLAATTSKKYGVARNHRGSTSCSIGNLLNMYRGDDRAQSAATRIQAWTRGIQTRAVFDSSMRQFNLVRCTD
jgi:hypothetical protein